jgi:hypothetical protein
VAPARHRASLARSTSAPLGTATVTTSGGDVRRAAPG